MCIACIHATEMSPYHCPAQLASRRLDLRHRNCMYAAKHNGCAVLGHGNVLSKFESPQVKSIIVQSTLTHEPVAIIYSEKARHIGVFVLPVVIQTAVFLLSGFAHQYMRPLFITPPPLTGL